MEAVVERPPAPTAQDALAALHADAFGWALSLCGRDRTLAEEVVQTAYLKALGGQARFDGRSSLKTWLFGVIRRTAASERRRLWTAAGVIARFGRLRPEPRSDDPESSAAATEAAAELASAMRRLSSRQREVLHLVFQQDMTIEAAAEVMGIGLGSARVHYERGKARLRELLPREGRR